MAQFPDTRVDEHVLIDHASTGACHRGPDRREVEQQGLGRAAGDGGSPQSWLSVAGVVDDIAAVWRPVEPDHAKAGRQWRRFPRHVQLLELLQQDVAEDGARVPVHANEREISPVRRNDGVTVAEIRGRMRQLASLAILERVQVDRRVGSRATLIAEDQMLAVRCPGEPVRPPPPHPGSLFRRCLEQHLLGTTEHRQHDNLPLSLEETDERNPLTVGRPRRRMVRRGILRQLQLGAAVDGSEVDVEVISTPTVPRERDQLAVGRDRGIDFQSLESGDGHGPRRGRRGVTPSQPGPERRAHRRQAEGDDHHMPQTDSPGPGGLETRGGRNLGAHQGCRRGRCSRRCTAQRTDEPVAAAWQRLDIARDVGRIIERLAQAPNRRVQAGLEVDERIGGPEAIAQCLAGDELARTLEQRLQNRDGLVGNLEARGAVAQLPRPPVERERAESNHRGDILFLVHGAIARPREREGRYYTTTRLIPPT